MGKYEAPKRQLHRDFVYLDHDSILNSLSAFEAGRIDEIIEKTSDATDKAVDGAAKLGPLKGGGSRKSQSGIQEELVRKRTRFSAFEAWYRQLDNEDAVGRFDMWDLQVRNAVHVGDTLEFVARVRLSPLHLLFATFASYAKEAGPQSTMFKTTAAAAADARTTSKMIEGWMRGPGGSQSTAVYMEPAASDSPPRIVGRVVDGYLLRGLGELDGTFTIVGQIENVIAPGEQLSAIRVIRDAPPTPLETTTIMNALAGFKGDVANAMGVTIDDDDIIYTNPAVLIRPIAIFR